jgi:hypothetical protein
MKKKRPVDQRCCALKLDMRKVYDKLEWNYLHAVMLKLGFCQAWVDMVMRLVSIVCFSVLFNGDSLDNLSCQEVFVRVIQSPPIYLC